MSYTRRVVNHQEEEQILVGMILSDQYLREIRQFYDQDMVDAPFVRIVAQWCLDYWEEHEKAPERDIELLYNDWEDEADADMAKAVKDFLARLSQEYSHADKFNAAYFLGKAEKKFRQRSLADLAVAIQSAAAEGDLEDAEQYIAEYKKVQRPQSEAINPFTNEDAIDSAFSEQNKPLFTFPGALGSFLNTQMCRDSLVGFMAPDKVGKSWLLQDIAMKAAYGGCNVAMFQVGDMTQAQSMRRMHIHQARKSDKAKYCGRIFIPVLDCKHNQNGACVRPERCCDGSVQDVNDRGELVIIRPEDADSDYSPCTACKANREGEYEGAVWYKERGPVTPLDAQEAKEVGKRTDRAMKGTLKLSTHDSGDISMGGIDHILQMWEDTEGFVCDVVIIDYADLLAPERKQDFRHEQNETWMKGRQISQKRNLLMVTASQTNREAYDTALLTRNNFSEDKRKLAHVTGMAGINQTEEEKMRGTYRLNWIVLRDDEYLVSRCVNVLSQPKIGRAVLGSFF